MLRLGCLVGMCCMSGCVLIIWLFGCIEIRWLVKEFDFWLCKFFG